jgi:hypothetical protein
MARSKKRHDDISSPASERPGEPGRDSNGNFTDRVAARAYELYLARGAGDGMAVEDWLAAERELSPPPGESHE